MGNPKVKMKHLGDLSLEAGKNSSSVSLRRPRVDSVFAGGKISSSVPLVSGVDLDIAMRENLSTAPFVLILSSALSSDLLHKGESTNLDGVQAPIIFLILNAQPISPRSGANEEEMETNQSLGNNQVDEKESIDPHLIGSKVDNPLYSPIGLPSFDDSILVNVPVR
ncbi:hypothetical protein Cni_G09993 [Canna indica]|uniref:Uncharacterized protein n=1 Tax=Canna indica TaxID=4628 RepID=A0AAQ3K6P6_9LILI|nr:hypothetical protein Cni_G09993 [Canna indica]